MKTITKNTYETPSATAVEVKAEGVICQSVLKTLWIGSENGGDPYYNGVEDYTSHDTQNW